MNHVYQHNEMEQGVRTSQAVRVLVVDDSELIRERIRKLLHTVQGIELVAEAKDGVEATTLIGEHKPRVLILDLLMPVKGGFEVLIETKASLPETIVIVLTNHASSLVRAHCKKNGADFVFDKSSEFEQVIDALREIQSRESDS